MKQIKWNEGWKFWPDKDAFALVWDVPGSAKDITLPHDAMIESPADPSSPNKGNTGYRNGGNYTYRNLLQITQDALSQRHVLKLEGVYCHAMVYVNEQLAGSEANGYTGFYVDLTPWLHAGDNEIRVQVKNAGMSNSRWYSGSGIYRDVYLLNSGKVCIEPDGVQVRTEDADEAYAVLGVATTVENRSDRAVRLCIKSTIRDQKEAEVGAEESVFFLHSGESRTVRQRILVRNPQLWSDESPALYAVESRLFEADCLLDTAQDRFGIRTLSLDAARGLRLNGKSVKLRGACIHHDSGLLGAATYEDAHRRQIRLLKEAGFNAIRMSHHPAAPALLRICDELGMLVMDEFSDMWQRAKCDLDYAMDFDKSWENDVRLMVRKDFNHPSVVLYSVGNEIPEIGTDAGSETCAKIAGLFHALDPGRYTTAGVNGVFAAGDRMGEILSDLSKEMREAGEIEGNVNDFMSVMDTKMDQIVCHRAISERLEKAFAPLDIAGYNYMAARYEPDSLRYPNRVLLGTETYPGDIVRNWTLVEKLPSVIGDFTWTGWDYIGEAGIGVPGYRPGEGCFGAEYPCQLAYCGDLDLTGFRRPLSYLREIAFGLRSRPYLAVQNPRHYGETLLKTAWILSDADAAWDWPGCEGKPVVVEVYTPGDEAELLCNGKSLGRRRPEGCRVLFETVYEPGELRAVAYESGKLLGDFVLRTPEKETALSLCVDDVGEKLCYLTAEITDGNGNVCISADETLTAEVEGTQLLGFGSGDPKPLHNYNEGKCRTWKGRAQLILKKTDSEKVRVRISAESGKTAELLLP